MIGYDLERMTPGGVKKSHHEGKVETDGPFLIMHSPVGDVVELLVPAHSLIELTPCRGAEGGCRHGGE